MGGGAVLFRLLQAYPTIQQTVLNDINPDLITAYQLVQQQPEELIAALLNLQQAYHRLPDEAARLTCFEAVRAEFNSRPLPAVRNTALLPFLNRTCFNGLYRVNSKGGFNVPFCRYDQPVICYPAVIRAASRVLARVTIVQGDFAALAAYATPESFWYFDPPYKPPPRTASFNAYATEVFGDADQQPALAQADGGFEDDPLRATGPVVGPLLGRTRLAPGLLLRLCHARCPDTARSRRAPACRAGRTGCFSP